MGEAVTRRAVLGRGFAVAVGLLTGGGVRLRPLGGARKAMARSSIDYDAPCFPVWECHELLKKAAAGNYLHEASNEAIRVLAGDPPHIVKNQSNYHTLVLGPQGLLHDEAEEFVRRIQSQFDFDANSVWRERAGSIAGIIRSYYPEGGQELGVLSLMPMRRPAPFRIDQERGTQVVSVTRPRVDFYSRKFERVVESFPLGGLTERFDLPLAGLAFACSAGTHPAENRLTRLLVRRRIRAAAFGLPPDQEYYRETWLCQACRGKDEARLLRGQIPAISPNRYVGITARVRASPILHLVKINIDQQRFHWLGMELDAQAGGLIFSVRHGSMPLSVAVLTASPVEHIAYCQILRRLLG